TQRFALQRVLTRPAFLWTAKSSSVAPSFSLSRNQTGCAPLPAHVLPALSRYLTATLRPFSELPRALNPISCPSIANSAFNSCVLRVRTFSISSRSFKSASIDIDATLALAIAASRQKKTTYPHFERETKAATRVAVGLSFRSKGSASALTSYPES